MAAQNSAPAAPASRWFDSTFLVMILLLLLWPVGVFALFKNRRMGGFGKFVVGGMMTTILFAGVGVSGFAGYWYYKYRTFANLQYVGKYFRKTEVADARTDTNNPPPTDKEPEKDAPPKNVADARIPPPDVKSSDAKPDPKTADAKPPAIPDNKPDPAVAAREAAEKQKYAEALQRAKELAEEKARFDAEQKAKALASAKAKLEEAQAEKEKAEREKLAAEEAAHNFDRQATELKDRVLVVAARKDQQAKKYKSALEDYNAATTIEPHLSNMDVAFKRHLVETYKSDAVDEARFYEYFTDDYLRNYNAQLKRQQAAQSQYIKTLRDGDAQIVAEEKKLAAEIDAANGKLAAAGKPRIELPPPNPELEKSLNEEREAAANLPERVVTMNDLRERFNIKSGKRPPQPVADNRNVRPKDPFDPKQSADVGDVVPLPPADNKPRAPELIAKPPVRSPPAPDVNIPKAPEPPPAIATADLLGDWLRGEGRVVWELERGGTMNVRGVKRSQGSWVFDEKTSVLSVTHGGVFFKFTVTKDAGGLSMLGGPGPNAKLKFTKTR